MRIFEALNRDNDIRYICCSKSTKIPAGYRIIEDVTKKERIEYDFLAQELESTEIPKSIQRLIVALVAEHQQKIFREV